jgi:hypothetical protein
MDLDLPAAKTPKRLVRHYRICPDCRAKNMPQCPETDAWQYGRKPMGFRLVAAFDLLLQNEGIYH